MTASHAEAVFMYRAQICAEESSIRRCDGRHLPLWL